MQDVRDVGEFGQPIARADHAALFPRLRSEQPGNYSCESLPLMRKLTALDEVRFYLVERNSLFVSPRPRDKHILNIFP